MLTDDDADFLGDLLPDSGGPLLFIIVLVVIITVGIILYYN